MTKQLYLGLWASNEKNKTTLFHETLKVEENKVVLFFIKGPQMDLLRFFCFIINCKLYEHFFQLKTHLSG